MFFYKQNEVKAASYSRLSREDGDKMESDSIRNQKDLIADYAAINGNQSFVRCVRMVAKEVLEVANAEGVALTGDDVESMIKRIGRLTDHGQTSMLQDVLAKRDTENKYFAGAVSRLGKKHGIETPYCEFINHLLEAKRYVYNS